MKLISIGRFSEMTRLSVKALRLYDEKGLLSPARIDASSGYRYYHQSQTSRAEAIKILRSVDLSINEIKEILGNSAGQASQQLAVHRAKLVERLATQERMLDYLESVLLQKPNNMPYEVSILELAPQKVAAVKFHTSLNQIGNDIAKGFGTLMAGLVSAAVSGSPMIIYHQVIDKESDGDVEICVPVEDVFSNSGQVYCRELAQTRVASIVHQGPYEEIGPAYHQLTSWVSEQDYEISGPPRETYLNDPNMVAATQLLTQLDFPITSW